jgi:molybdopterin converting factor small subunit
LKENYAITAPDIGIMAVLNGKGWMQYPQKLQTKIKDGDAILLFPPISGG